MSSICTLFLQLILSGTALGAEFVVTTADTTFAREIDPLSRLRSDGTPYTVAQYYSYNTPWSASSNTPDALEQSGTLLLFLFDDGTDKSLVIISDKPNDGSGHTLSMTISGLQGAEWTVKNDPGDSSYAIAADGTSSPYWSSWPCCNDGGAITFPDGPIDVTIQVTERTNIPTTKLLTMAENGTISSIAIPAEDATLIRIRTLDTDYDDDGIPNDVDACPHDAENDADDDGICGDVDDCPYDDENDADDDTICGDVDVCPYDADNDYDDDGICGDVDDCPNDADNDQDDDGICGDVDDCPNDADNDQDDDGVCGDVDNCPTVPNPGQENSDGDAYGDACPPDSDGDGLDDDVDTCPDSAPGALVDASGCSLDDLVPCAGWRNHGAYVSAYAKAVRDFAAAGLLTGAEAGAATSAAARSTCGK